MTSPFKLQSPYHPTTFAERGVAVYFTTPALTGSRVRAGVRDALELIVPSLSGGRGFYVLPWPGVADFCRPTVHDRHVHQGTAALSQLTPGAVRTVANGVAMAGFAGRDARARARTLQAEDSQAQVVTQFSLLLMLAAQLEGRAPELHQFGSPEIEQRAKRAIAQSAPRLGLHPDTIAVALGELASLLKPVGLGPAASAAAHVRTTTRLGALREDMCRWASTHYGESAGMADIVSGAADLTLSCASVLIENTRAMAGQTIGLLKQWCASAEATASALTRPEWLLDGWEPVCAIWDGTEQNEAALHSALVEMVQLVPILPKQAGDWVDETVTQEAAKIFRRSTELNKDWRPGLPHVDLIARNERRRALIC